jgi:hypothetical protein
VQQQAALVQRAEAAAFQQAAQTHQAHVEQQFNAQQHAAAAQAQAFMAERNEVQALIGRLDQILSASLERRMRILMDFCISSKSILSSLRSPATQLVSGLLQSVSVVFHLEGTRSD